MKAVSRDEEPMDPEMQQRLPLYGRQKVHLGRLDHKDGSRGRVLKTHEGSEGF